MYLIFELSLPHIPIFKTCHKMHFQKVPKMQFQKVSQNAFFKRCHKMHFQNVPQDAFSKCATKCIFKTGHKKCHPMSVQLPPLLSASAGPTTKAAQPRRPRYCCNTMCATIFFCCYILVAQCVLLVSFSAIFL